jgi:hypothetical protein
LHLLTRKLPPSDRAQVARRLGLKPAEAQAFRNLPAEAARLAKELAGKSGAKPTKLYQLLSSTRPDLILLVLAEYPQATVQNRIRNYLRKFLPMRAKLPGKELEQLGVASGTPRFTKILEQFFYAMLEGKVRSKPEQTKLLKKLAQTLK